MARELNKLSARRVQTLAEPGRHSDGGGLYLIVDDGGAKRWVVFYRSNGKRREMGLGSLSAVPLARARERAAEIRQQVAEGRDPIADRRTPPSREAHPTTFAEVADAFMADRESTWRNAAHRAQWRQTLEIQAASLWIMPVEKIDTDAVLSVLRPMWGTKAETARRLRGRIERVLDAARAMGKRSADNPARWRGHLDAILPKAKKLTRGHHAAMRYAEVPTFMTALRERPAIAARALELAILTAARSGEVRGMVWGEVDLTTATWSIPAGRMKAGRAHRVPLQAAAVAILAAHRPDDASAADLIFPNGAGKKHSDVVFTALLRRMKREDVTAHGFRSSFRDWAAEETEHPREVIEAALAHLVGDETERAYRRGDALAKRRALMDHWAAFLAGGAPSTKA